jgi:hypothetical protein
VADPKKGVMKIVSFCMLALLLFSLLGKGSERFCPMQTCPYMSGKMPVQGNSKNDKKGGCQNCCGCNAMVTVSGPVYITTELLILKPLISLPVQICMPLYRVGELSDHHASDWKPPKFAIINRTT